MAGNEAPPGVGFAVHNDSNGSRVIARSPTDGRGLEARFKVRDAASYDPVVAAFDRLSERYTAALAERLVELASLVQGERVLDVATGTGVVASTAARQCGGSRVVGVDLSAGMVRRAQQKALSAAWVRPPEWLRADGERLALQDRSFDAVLSLYGLLHFPRPELALAEMHRVLRPGGRVVIAIGAGPPRLSLAGWVDGVRRLWALVQRRRGRLLEAPHLLHRLLDEHLSAGVEPEETPLARRPGRRVGALSHLLRGAGFCRVRCSWQGHQPRIATAGEFWQIQSTFSSRARKRLAAAPEGAVAEIRREFFAACERVLRCGGRLVYPYAALFVSGVRASGGWAEREQGRTV
ncbi:MAG: methyltransferase domain-containing protein [Thermoanaerobaculia bacterium]